MKKDADGAKTVLAKQWITGTVTRDGRPVKVGWVGLWYVRGGWDVVNAPIMRGRTVEPEPTVLASAAIADGKYRLEVPMEDDNWYVVAEEAGHAPTQIGPIAIALRQEKKLDIACVKGGSIAGNIKNVPKGWEEHLWVVAFTKTGVRADTRVNPDGTYRLNKLPPGEYGVKVGHDAYLDAEVPRGKALPKEAWEKLAEPWKNARVVRVQADRLSDDVKLELPPGAALPSR
ncbi:MAG: carboxypeptidase regulatory-like domain-containing protein [Gemmataceae bacterium]|nr:carboxypeptidase regulatory-like domain-containing protein [Gemmataceae bacterium]